MRSSPHALVLAILAAATGCERTPDLDPRPTSLEPAGSNGAAPTPVVIRGTGFHGRVVQDGAGGISSAEAAHRAWIDDTLELADVTWVDAFTLHATVPAGLALGPHSLTVENAFGRRGRLEGAFTVIVPTFLSASASSAPAVASIGQTISVTVAVANPGMTPVLAVSPEVVVSGTGTLDALPLPTPVDLAPGEQRMFVLPLLASGAGSVTLDVTARGTEAFTGRPLSVSAPAGTVTVVRAASLTGTLSLPSTIAPGAAFTATLLVTNRGEAATLAVTPAALTAAAGAVAPFSVDGPPSPASATVAGGGSVVFTWPCTLLGPGRVRLATSAAGTDENGGFLVETGRLESNLGGQTPEVVAGPSDPFGDGLVGGALAVFGERLYWGPSVNGAALWSRGVDSGTATTEGLTLGVDLGSSRSSNSYWRANPPATTIGAAGCTPGTPLCGPNDEGARGVLSAGVLGGSERLLLAGAPATSGGQFLYLAPAGGPLAFSFLDLGISFVGPQTLAPTAALFAPGTSGGADRLYMGFSGPVADQAPVLVGVVTPPPAAGLDAARGRDAIDLRADLMPWVGGGGFPPNVSPVPRIDVIRRIGDTVYVANDGGILASTVPVPASFVSRPGDWAVATPAAAAYWDRASVRSSRATDLTPADRAFPSLVQFGPASGPHVFAARNVSGASPPVAGQLWACAPGLSGDGRRCEPGDWALVAPNETGDATLTQLGAPANGAISVLVETPRYLYVGFDNATTGVQLFRTEGVPVIAADFRGRDGCAAGSPGCEGLGGNGLGDPAAFTRFLDAEVLSGEGGASLFVVAGNGVGPSRLFELPE